MDVSNFRFCKVYPLMDVKRRFVLEHTFIKRYGGQFFLPSCQNLLPYFYIVHF